MDARYQFQVQWQIACTESDYAYFASYHPDFGKDLRLKFVKVEKDDKIIAELEKAVREFDIEVEGLINDIKNGGNKDG